MNTELFACFESGGVTVGDVTRDAGSLPWKAHPKFAGVFLKDMVTAEATGGLFTCHLVRIDPGCAIGLHTHPDSIELHEVVAGEGACVTQSGAVHYAPGSVAVLARNAPHEVRAGDKGLRLFAKFISAPA